MSKVNYSEPKDYIPKAIRKELGLGEFAKNEPKGKKDEQRAKENEELRKVFKGK